VQIVRPGGPEVLEIGDAASPQPGAGEVLIRMTAATVNPTDLLLRARGAGDAISAPWTPGMEIAGTIESVGEDTTFRTGERVFGIANAHSPKGGAQAELVVLPAGSVARTPKNVSDPEAATLPMNGLTVLQALRRLHLAPGSTLGVIGSAGAVGQYAIQLAVAAGLRVVADAKPEDEDLVREFGAHEVVPRSKDVAASFRTVIPGGTDGLIDAAVVDALALGAIKDGGALATLRMWNGPTERGIRIEPVWVPDDNGNTAGLQELADHALAGRLSPRIAAVLPMQQIQDAHRRLEAGGIRGRIVLVP
jgi:NADPH2:quinone reductase